jgi:hypothetical protein
MAMKSRFANAHSASGLVENLTYINIVTVTETITEIAQMEGTRWEPTKAHACMHGVHKLTVDDRTHIKTNCDTPN